jgi:hypothetical protein
MLYVVHVIHWIDLQRPTRGASWRVCSSANFSSNEPGVSAGGVRRCQWGRSWQHVQRMRNLMSLECRRMPSFLAIADFLRPQSLVLGSTFIYGVRISFESFSGVITIIRQ